MKKLTKGLMLALALLFMTAPAYAWPWTKPKLTDDDAKEWCKFILAENKEALSPGNSFRFNLRTCSLQKFDKKKGAHEFYVKYTAKLNDGESYEMTRTVYVGKDKTGVYVEMHVGTNDRSMTKLRTDETNYPGEIAKAFE